MPNPLHKVLHPHPQHDRIPLFPLLMLSVLLGFSGCVYPRPIALNAPFSNLSVPLFQNATFEPLLEKTLTSIFKTTLYEQGWQVNAGASAQDDAQEKSKVLIGRITSFGRKPISLDQIGRAREYRINITLKVTLLKSKDGAERFSKLIEGEAEYIARPGSEEDRTAKDRAIREAGRDMAHRLLVLMQADLLQAVQNPEKEGTQ